MANYKAVFFNHVGALDIILQLPSGIKLLYALKKEGIPFSTVENDATDLISSSLLNRSDFLYIGSSPKGFETEMFGHFIWVLRQKVSQEISAKHILITGVSKDDELWSKANQTDFFKFSDSPHTPFQPKLSGNEIYKGDQQSRQKNRRQNLNRPHKKSLSHFEGLFAFIIHLPT